VVQDLSLHIHVDALPPRQKLYLQQRAPPHRGADTHARWGAGCCAAPPVLQTVACTLQICCAKARSSKVFTVVAHYHCTEPNQRAELLTATCWPSCRSRASCTNPYEPRLMSRTFSYFSMPSNGSDGAWSAPCIACQRAAPRRPQRPGCPGGGPRAPRRSAAPHRSKPPCPRRPRVQPLGRSAGRKSAARERSHAGAASFRATQRRRRSYLGPSAGWLGSVGSPARAVLAHQGFEPNTQETSCSLNGPFCFSVWSCSLE